MLTPSAHVDCERSDARSLRALSLCGGLAATLLVLLPRHIPAQQVVGRVLLVPRSAVERLVVVVEGWLFLRKGQRCPRPADVFERPALVVVRAQYAVVPAVPVGTLNNAERFSVEGHICQGQNTHVDTIIYHDTLHPHT